MELTSTRSKIHRCLHTVLLLVLALANRAVEPRNPLATRLLLGLGRQQKAARGALSEKEYKQGEARFKTLREHIRILRPGEGNTNGPGRRWPGPRRDR